MSFRIGAEEYGINILQVREIRSYEAPTRIADAPRFVKGVLNLRGIIMPVVDLRSALDCDRAGVDASTVLIVVNVGLRLVGLVVDAVSDVLDLPAAAVRAAPLMASRLESSFINGIASVQDRMLILIDIEVLMDAPWIGLAGQASQ